jgi:integrase
LEAPEDHRDDRGRKRIRLPGRSSNRHPLYPQGLSWPPFVQAVLVLFELHLPVRGRVLATTIGEANRARNKARLPPIQEGVTNHTLRRTFASLLYEAGASPAYVMAQMRHTSSALALEVYARKMDRQRDTGERMDALLRGADWAQTGTNGTNGNGAVPPATEGPL